MALNKAITNEKGITTNYHKIGTLSLVKVTPKEETDETSHLLCVNVSSFVSEDYRRESEKLAVSSRDYNFKITLAELTETPILTLAYNKLKSLPMFDGAEDC